MKFTKNQQQVIDKLKDAGWELMWEPKFRSKKQKCYLRRQIGNSVSTIHVDMVTFNALKFKGVLKEVRFQYFTYVYILNPDF